jgi:hypothetical protein
MWSQFCWYDRRRKKHRDDHYEELEAINTEQQALFSDPAPDRAWIKFQDPDPDPAQNLVRQKKKGTSGWSL